MTPATTELAILYKEAQILCRHILRLQTLLPQLYKETPDLDDTLEEDPTDQEELDWEPNDLVYPTNPLERTLPLG